MALELIRRPEKLKFSFFERNARSETFLAYRFFSNAILNVALEVIVILCDVANYIIAIIMKSFTIHNLLYYLFRECVLFQRSSQSSQWQ